MLGKHVRLALEAGESVAIVDEGLGDDLQCDIAAELGIRCPIHAAHAAFAEESDDIEGSEPVADVHRHALNFDRPTRSDYRGRWPVASGPEFGEGVGSLAAESYVIYYRHEGDVLIARILHARRAGHG
jgi:hypothetical protein